MKVTQDEVVDRQALLHVEVEDERLETHLQRAYQKLVQRTTIPGFRKGKAPRRLFEQMIGRSVLVEEALETLVPDAVAAAIEQEDIDAYGTPRVSVTESEPVPKLDVTVPLRPSVTLGDYSGIEVEEETEEVTDEQVDQAVEQAQISQATWDPVERPLEIGDQAVLTVEGKAGDEEVLNGDNVEFVLTEDSQTPIPGFTEAIVGMEPGQTKEFSLDIAEDFPGDQVAGKTVECKVELFEVKLHNLPEIDDDLARSVGQGYESLDEMKTGLRTQFEEAATATAQRELQEKIVEALLETSEFEIPPLIVEHEAEHVLNDQQQALARYQVSMQDYMQNAGKTGEELLEEAKESALTRLKRTILIEEVAKAEEIDVSDEDVEAEIETLLANAGPQADRSQVESEEAQASIKSMILRRKSVEKLAEIVQSKGGTPAKATTAEAEAPADEEESSSDDDDSKKEESEE
ncbi:MAG: trigger factor [Chloroflexi bacterium]|nr:trigger factor [Chloroflexota bacterium]MBT4072891.1 trigger factor [Chloroflexota bacterium]MBT4515791.1 trigger factor [Chloroflexota bacterium]MBT6681174.1 trigger factor [Chloroflexota bacterium]